VTIPGIGPDISQGGRRWHHAFHMTPELPKRWCRGREREYLGWFYREFCWQRGAIEPADVENTSAAMAAGRTERGLRYYRSLPQDKADNRAILESGSASDAGARARRRAHRGAGSRHGAARVAAEIASDVRGFEIPECGHFIPEEQPALLADHLLRFFAR
jgi:pimeloyl-ACP methyl ester carboxylesterase